MDSKFGYVVVEGPIGVGKTSLVRRLADVMGSEVFLEQPEANPFLERFYQSPRQYALPTQLFFLFQRAKQIEQLKQGDMFRPGCVADFMLEKDRLFAETTLERDELHLYEQVYNHVKLELPQPDLVIYLQAPVNVLIERIRRRGIRYEQYAQQDYLERLSDAYMQFFYRYNNAPLLMVNTAELNFVDDDRDFRLLLEHIETMGPGRHFFNPVRV
ncbi:MAG: deoxynucleoside kinase [Gammaproteobacteria bacterium]|nr:deoxynucleoside kinase [Gammaproteobacteria bacterium]